MPRAVTRNVLHTAEEHGGNKTNLSTLAMPVVSVLTCDDRFITVEAAAAGVFDA